MGTVRREFLHVTSRLSLVIIGHSREYSFSFFLHSKTTEAPWTVIQEVMSVTVVRIGCPETVVRTETVEFMVQMEIPGTVVRLGGSMGLLPGGWMSEIVFTDESLVMSVR